MGTSQSSQAEFSSMGLKPGLQVSTRSCSTMHSMARGMDMDQKSYLLRVIDDLDAGVARFKDDKATVNNQIVQASLMNLCDDPTRVSLGLGSSSVRAWDSREERDPSETRDENAPPRRVGTVTCRRVPIVVTGNDFSRLYAPLTRAGRMDLWHWEPSREEIANMLHETLRAETGYGGLEDARALVARFPDQPLDFFAAARARCADLSLIHI